MAAASTTPISSTGPGALRNVTLPLVAGCSVVQGAAVGRIKGTNTVAAMTQYPDMDPVGVALQGASYAVDGSVDIQLFVPVDTWNFDNGTGADECTSADLMALVYWLSDHECTPRASGNVPAGRLWGINDQGQLRIDPRYAREYGASGTST